MKLHRHPSSRTRPLLVLAHLSHLQGRLQEVPAALLERLRPVFEDLPKDDPAREALESSLHSLEQRARRTALH
jgi:hypothetical protein